MKFTIEKIFKGENKGQCTMEIDHNGAIGVFSGTNRECWDFIEEYVNDNKVQSFSVVDVFGKQHDYFRFA